MAKYAFGLAQSFNAFYHRYSILNEERADARIWRAAAVAYYRTQLTKALELMGATCRRRCRPRTRRQRETATRTGAA